MINFDFDYYKPSDLESAYKLFTQLSSEGKKVVYYAGGTELVTLFRKGTIRADAVIDLKGVKGICEVEMNKEITIGACSTLNDIIEIYDISILKNILIHIGDHTVRNAITLGGNICGRLPYKEALLPLIALNAQLVIYGQNGLYTKALREVFDKRLKLDKGEILYQIKYESKTLKYSSRRYTETTATDYPLVHVLVVDDDEKMVLVSGFHSYPIYQLYEIESLKEIKASFNVFGKDNIRGSSNYKRHLLMDAIDDIFAELEVCDG